MAEYSRSRWTKTLYGLTKASKMNNCAELETGLGGSLHGGKNVKKRALQPVINMWWSFTLYAKGARD